jgi:hypothetical protein
MKIISCKGPSLDKANKKIPYYVQYEPRDTSPGFVTIKSSATLFEDDDIERVMMKLRYYWGHINDDEWKITSVWLRVTAKGEYD